MQNLQDGFLRHLVELMQIESAKNPLVQIQIRRWSAIDIDIFIEGIINWSWKIQHI